MKIGITNYYIDKYGLDDGISRMANHGYTDIDFQVTNVNTEFYTLREEDFLTLVLDIKRKFKEHGITVNQIHGPWPYPSNNSTEDQRAELFGMMTKALVVAKHLGAKYMAIHPLMPYGVNSPENPEEVYNINKRYYTALAKVAHGLGVTVCLENMSFKSFPLASSEMILKLIKDINHPFLRLCFDTGHAHVLGENLGDAVRNIGKDYLKVIHAHDNFGDEDSHRVPYDGSIDWADFAEGLYDIGFDGVFSLETEPISSEESNNGISTEQIEAKELELAKIAKLIAG